MQAKYHQVSMNTVRTHHYRAHLLVMSCYLPAYHAPSSNLFCHDFCPASLCNPSHFLYIRFRKHPSSLFSWSHLFISSDGLFESLYPQHRVHVRCIHYIPYYALYALHRAHHASASRLHAPSFHYLDPVERLAVDHTSRVAVHDGGVTFRSPSYGEIDDVLVVAKTESAFAALEVASPKRR